MNTCIFASSNLPILTAFVSAISAFVAFSALIVAIRTRRTNLKKEFIVYAMERLRDESLRKLRGKVFGFTDEEIEVLVQDIVVKKQNIIIDDIRKQCLAFDEIGYLVYKLGLLKYRDILDIYPQTIKFWNKIQPIIKVWRDREDKTSFVYFEMLVSQRKINVDPTFEMPLLLLYKKQPKKWNDRE